MMNGKAYQEGNTLAMSYVPWHNWEALYEEGDALERGTAFPSLDLPFYGKGAC